MQTQEAIIALGANLGDAASIIKQAVHDLDIATQISITICSSIYRSKPMVRPTLSDLSTEPQPDYMNAVVLARVEYKPMVLLDYLQLLERKYGRVRSQYWGPRTLDLDIITYSNQMIDSPRLTIPHPEAYRRCFVLAPLMEILPDFVIPGYGKVSELLPKCTTGKVTKIGAIH